MESAVVFLVLTMPWCGACVNMKRDYAGDERLQFIDAQANPDQAKQHRVKVYPTVVALKDGREIGRTVGYNNRAEMDGWMRRMQDHANRQPLRRWLRIWR